MPDFLTSTKPSVMVRNPPWPPTMSTCDDDILLLLLLSMYYYYYYAKWCVLSSYQSWHSGFIFELYFLFCLLQTISSVLLPWKSVNNGMKTTFKAVPSFYKREWNHCRKGLAFIFSFQPVPLLLLFLQDICI